MYNAAVVRLYWYCAMTVTLLSFIIEMKCRNVETCVYPLLNGNRCILRTVLITYICWSIEITLNLSPSFLRTPRWPSLCRSISFSSIKKPLTLFILRNSNSYPNTSRASLDPVKYYFLFRINPLSNSLLSMFRIFDILSRERKFRIKICYVYY